MKLLPIPSIIFVGAIDESSLFKGLSIGWGVNAS
ncbi:hypothetical protein Cal7507_5768 [Calothrix sp. PCC 7507]|nr:hypothetical protein Cal7507_5768 [Calothrix sp. PCC 7507]